MGLPNGQPHSEKEKIVMKKISMMLAMVFVLSCIFSVQVFALTDGDWEFKLLDNEVTVTGYLGESKDVVIPKEIYGTSVTKVLMDNGKNFKAATSITFPETVTEVKNLSSYSETLEKVTFNEGLKIIHDRALQENKKLKYVNIPSTIEEIGDYAFYACKALESVTFPASLKKLGQGAYEHSGVKSVDFTSANPTIGEFSFLCCESLESVNLGTALTNVGSSMFSGAKSLKEVIIPNTVTMIKSGGFRECESLESIILPTSLKHIGIGAFTGCKSLVEVVIPYGVTAIENAFGDCTNLKSLYVPDTVSDRYPVFVSGTDNCIVYCTADSPTAAECKDRGISYLTDNSVNSGITVLYNGTRISFHAHGQNPELINNRTLVPLRSIFEAMNAKVEWDGATNTAIATRGAITVKVPIGESAIYKNGSAIPTDVPAQLINDRTMVPARVIAESFGADVQWNGYGNVVMINE